jgi:hypothetical protein
MAAKGVDGRDESAIDDERSPNKRLNLTALRAAS